MYLYAPNNSKRFENKRETSYSAINIAEEWAKNLEIHMNSTRKITYYDFYNTYKRYKLKLKKQVTTEDVECIKIMKKALIILLGGWKYNKFLLNIINEACLKYDPITFNNDLRIFEIFSKVEDSYTSHKIDIMFLLFETNFKIEYNKNFSKGSSYLYTSIIDTFLDTIGVKDSYTKKHSERVYLIAKQFGNYISLSNKKLEELIVASILHDVGKIGISELILTKRGKLTEEEYEIIKRHTEYGELIVKKVPGFDRISNIIKYHHERYDGKGYYKLPSEFISQNMYIIALCDSFDSMNSNRSYREALKFDVIIEEYKRCSGKQFEPKLCDKFINFLILKQSDIQMLYEN